jgi:uncharacterized protein
MNARRFAASVVLALFLTPFAGIAALAADFKVPPRPTTEVVDTANALSSDAKSSLETQLEAFEASTGHHVVVYIAQTTGNVPLETWTAETAQSWKVGQKGKDDGAILFLFMKDHKVRIEVGYGLESTLTDAAASQIIADQIVPKMKSGDTDGAVRDGVNGMLAAISPSTKQTETAPPPDTSATTSDDTGDDIGFWGYMVGGGFILVALFGIIYVPMSMIASWRKGYLIKHEGAVAGKRDMKRSWLSFFLADGVASSGSSGGGFFSGFGGGGGGGFSGGSFGGGFGGGGASGSW